MPICYNLTMSRILIVGNILKDVYLRLDERQNTFEKDEDETPWLDLSFDGESHPYFRRTSVYGGAAITLEVFSKFSLKASVIGSKIYFEDNEIIVPEKSSTNYRYILCHGEDISYFVPSERLRTNWEDPQEMIDWIFVDRSASLTPKLVQDIKKYLSFSKNTQLAVHIDKHPTRDVMELAKDATLVFVENQSENLITSGKICKIKDNSVELDGQKKEWNLSKTDLMTHLTVYSIASASIFSAIIQGKSVNDALLFAKLNVENSTINKTLDFEKLEQLVKEAKNGNSNMRLIAASLVTPGKGILAADESGGSIKKKFASMNIEDTEQNRRDYRNIFFTTPEIENYVSGVILFDETSKQKADDGRNFVEFLSAKGIIPGIKVDKGLVNFPNSAEKYTEGLDGLTERLDEYYKSGLRFAKWRAAFEIAENIPTARAVLKNCEILAEYAKKCQDSQIVPIVEPEVVHDGNYGIKTCAKMTGQILDVLFEKLADKKVRLDACILKVNMILAGKQFPVQSTPEEVGYATAEVLRAHVPKELAGVVFLSGGQTPEQATANLQAVTNNGPFPWPVTFSFARALQDPALNAWGGDNTNTETARKAFYARLVANTDALKKH